MSGFGYFVVKAIISGIMIAVVAEIARRSAAFGALIVSLPLISLMAILWLWRNTGDTDRIASHMRATFWYVLPSLPMFLVTPALLKGGWGFWSALGAGCVLTVCLYAVTIPLAARFGVRL